MQKIPFIKKDQRYYFKPNHMICSLEEYYFDYICLENVDSRFVRERFKSENYIVDELNKALILFDKGQSKYTRNCFKHKQKSVRYA